MKTFSFPSGAKMPQIGLGTWQAEGGEVKTAVKEALKAGYRCIDTAWYYNNAEKIGEALKESFESGVVTREELFYVTKLPCHGHRRPRNFLEIELQKTGLEYVDLYLIHFPVAVQHEDDEQDFLSERNTNIPLDEELDLLDTWKAMEECVDAGLAKDIGLSNFNIEQIQHIYENSRIKPANLQVECHIYFQQRELRELCDRLGITFTAYSPFGSPAVTQFLKDKYQRDISVPYQVLEEPLLKSLAQKYKSTPAQIALKFIVQLNVSVVAKSVSPERIKENIQVFDFMIDESDMKRLEALDKGIRIITFQFAKGIWLSKKYPFSEVL